VTDLPEGPPHGITLIVHARVAALIAEGEDPLLRVLEKEKITEAQWNESTSYWMMRMADDVMKNGSEARMPIVYSDVFSRTQDSLKPLPPMTPEEWGALTVDIQQAEGPAKPLATRNLSMADYLRLSRHWARTLSSDPAQQKRFFATYESLQPKGA
jgi:hypothetical protein